MLIRTRQEICPSIEDTLTLGELSPQSALSTTGRASNYYNGRIISAQWCKDAKSRNSVEQ